MRFIPKHLHKTYNSWREMQTKCFDEYSTRYASFGGRGIKVHPRWYSFEDFVADMGVRPEGRVLDLIDHSKDFAPGNCYWADRFEIKRNSLTAKLSEADVRAILKAVHQEGARYDDLELVYPVTAAYIRDIARGKHFHLTDYPYPEKIKRRKSKTPYRGGPDPKMSITKVVYLRRDYKAGVDIKELAARDGISVSNAYNIATGRSWRHVPMPSSPAD